MTAGGVGGGVTAGAGGVSGGVTAGAGGVGGGVTAGVKVRTRFPAGAGRLGAAICL